MRHTSLRLFMRNRNLSVRQDHVLKNCTVVIDGDSYFRGTYKESGCTFILGGEFDRYADYLKRALTNFIDSNVTCYVVFHGAMKADLEKRKEIHQKLITEKLTILPGDESYYEPVFVKDVYKQVLEELGIKYYVDVYGTLETLLDVSKEYNCSVITSNIEYCLFGMSCITPNSIKFDDKSKGISCKILTPGPFKRFFSVSDDMKPLLLTILDEDGPIYEKIPEITGKRHPNPVGPAVDWVRRQRREQAIIDLTKKLGTDKERTSFKESVEDLRKIMFYKRRSAAVKYFRSKKTSALSSENKDWFKEGVMTGRIAIPYVSLKDCGTFSGSWVICDKEKDDAMLPALDIVMYANNILKNSQKSAITFIGRISDKSFYEEITSDFKSQVSRKDIFEDRLSMDLMRGFVDKALPGFDWALLENVPEDSHLLLIAMMFLYSKAGSSFLAAAYSILLSYVMLGPVSEKVGLIKRSKLMSHSLDSSQEDGGHCSYEDCLTATEALIDYFYEGDLKKTFDRSILHELAEFQHSLQQMNYLNKLCGERIKSTNYYKTYNGTFVFNVLLRLREHKNPMNFLEQHLKGSPSVLQFYKHVKDIFTNCLTQFQN